MAPAKKQAVDRRAFTRVPHSARAVISSGRGEVEAKVVDLSVAGLQLEVRGALDRGEFVRVRLPLSPGDEASWVDPDALVVRADPSTTYGCSRVGVSFLALDPVVLQRLSDRVAEALAGGDASNEAPSTPAPAAQVAEPRARDFAPKKEPTRAKSPPPAAQRSPPRPTASTAPHPAPSPAANEPTKTPGIAQTLARLFGRRGKTPPAPPKRSGPAPASTAQAQPSRAELRDLFRSAIASVKTEDTKSQKR